MSYYIGNDIDLGTIVGSGESAMLGRRDRARHTYLVGSTRTGKSKLLEGMCRQDLLNWSEDQCPMVVMGSVLICHYGAGKGDKLVLFDSASLARYRRRVGNVMAYRDLATVQITTKRISRAITKKAIA